MLNWTAEDIEYLSNVMLKPYTKALTEEMAEYDDKSYEMCEKMILQMADLVKVRIKELNYNETRDRMFFMTLLCNQFEFDKDVLDNVYKEYCENFDALNKHLITEEDGKDE